MPIIDQLFTQTPHAEVIDRVHEFARDLAYGVANGWWEPHFNVTYYGGGGKDWYAGRPTPEGMEIFDQLTEKKWGKLIPSENVMVTFGYFERESSEVFNLTHKAFTLLEKPHRPPNIFISYKRDQSSAFGLLIEARLRIAGNPNPFIDKNIVAGEEWDKRLEESIKNSRYFVCLIGTRTLESPIVHQEIAWAEQYGCVIISIWHGGAKIDAATPPGLAKRHAIVVSGESAREYENAVNELLNSLGYSTY
jgi:hypothetical protein